MKNDAIQTFKDAAKNLIEVTDRIGITNISQFINNNNSNSCPDKNGCEESESNNKEYEESVQLENNKSYHDNISDNYNKRQDISLDSQGVIDSIANELTSAKLQQAIILSEIVGKPRSKTRRKRRF